MAAAARLRNPVILSVRLAPIGQMQSVRPASDGSRQHSGNDFGWDAAISKIARCRFTAREREQSNPTLNPFGHPVVEPPRLLANLTHRNPMLLDSLLHRRARCRDVTLHADRSAEARSAYAVYSAVNGRLTRLNARGASEKPRRKRSNFLPGPRKQTRPRAFLRDPSCAPTRLPARPYAPSRRTTSVQWPRIRQAIAERSTQRRRSSRHPVPNLAANASQESVGLASLPK
jgi:hypothetical protein